MPQHSAILRSPPHTRPWRPRRQSGSCTKWCTWRTRLSSVPRPRPGGSDRSRLASCLRALRTQPDFWNAQTKRHSTETLSNLSDSKLGKTIPIQHLHSCWQLNSIEMNDETTAPPTRPNFSLSEDFENMTSWHAAAFSDSAEPTTHQALAPLAPIWFSDKSLTNQCSWRTCLSSAPRPRPGGSDRSRLASC